MVLAAAVVCCPAALSWKELKQQRSCSGMPDGLRAAPAEAAERFQCTGWTLPLTASPGRLPPGCHLCAHQSSLRRKARTDPWQKSFQSESRCVTEDTGVYMRQLVCKTN